MPRVIVDLEELDLDTVALIEASAGKMVSTDTMRRIVAGFLVGDDGESLPHDEALAAAGKFKLREVRGVFEQLNATLERLKSDALPKVMSSPS